MHSQYLFFVFTFLTLVLTLGSVILTALFRLSDNLYFGSANIEDDYRGSGRIEKDYRGSGRLTLVYRGSGRLAIA